MIRSFTVAALVACSVALAGSANAAVYDDLFAEYKILHDYFGRGANDVMKRLKQIKTGGKKNG